MAVHHMETCELIALIPIVESDVGNLGAVGGDGGSVVGPLAVG